MLNQKIINYNINGRKIPSHFENPLDNYIISFCDYFIVFCLKYKITPNMITITRFFLSFYIIYLLYYTNFYFTLIGIAIFYFMDCLDGHLARLTDQVTILGDYLDHIADFFFYINFIIYIFYKSYKYKIYIIISFLILSYLACIHLSLQQKNYKLIIYKNLNKESIKHNIENCEILDKLNYLHYFEPNNIKWSRYFGMGTLYTSILGIVYFITINI